MKIIDRIMRYKYIHLIFGILLLYVAFSEYRQGNFGFWFYFGLFLGLIDMFIYFVLGGRSYYCTQNKKE